MKQLPARETSSNCNDTEKAGKRIDLLFSRFAAIYGHIWRSQFKDENSFLPFAKKEWQSALVGFSDVVLDTAINECRNFYELPPTLPQLLRCCRQVKERVEYRPPEPVIPISPEVRAQRSMQCKELLNNLQRRQSCWF